MGILKKKCNICNKNLHYDGHKFCHKCHQYFILDKNYNFNNHLWAEGGGSYSDEISKNSGISAEKSFVRSIIKKNYKIRPSTRNEDYYKHFDFIVEIIKNKVKKYKKIEVKSMKSKKRGSKPDPDLIYLELKNVCGGPGWLYGESDYIAFEQKKTFLLVPTKYVKNKVELNLDKYKLVGESGIIDTLYTRHNRHDLVLVCNINFIKTIKGSFELKK